jgi:FHA domain
LPADHELDRIADRSGTNGTFVRVSKVSFLTGTEVLFGRTRYRFESGQAAISQPPPSTVSDSQMTVRPGGAPLARHSGFAQPALVEVTQAGDCEKIALTRDEYWLGRDPSECAIVPRDDPFVSPRHARIFKEAGRWRAENNRSINGIWQRITQPLPVESLCQFLLGEQRFIFKVLT